MKHLPVAGKAITLLFTAALLVACSGSDTKKEDEEAAAAARAAAQPRCSSRRMPLPQLHSSVCVTPLLLYGNVFYFDYDSYTLKRNRCPGCNGRPHSRFALQGNEQTVRLEGHTDERGTREYNMALGERRANAVRDYMVGQRYGQLPHRERELRRRTSHGLRLRRSPTGPRTGA